ncbi:MFS transporter [Actinomadura sp. NPDC000600]|uniref:MFS transporter n=1 Tax=Actinomadura sp. NPDC000600 TaxID=3154262 RepID=UPI0033957A6E
MSVGNRMTFRAYLGFGMFGAFWGVWGASVPRLQEQAGVGDGGLGFALLFVGAGALPAMLLAGRALDRRGPGVAGAALAALGGAGVLVAFTAVNLASLCVGLAVVGATSGAADVAINAVAGRAEKAAGRPVITRAHGVFSSLVVLASLATGLVSSLPIAVPFAVVAAVCSGTSVGFKAGAVPGARSRQVGAPPEEDVVRQEAAVPLGRRRTVPLVLVGVLGAFAFASENAHQSWSAVFLHDEFHAGGLSAVAPAVFAGTVAITRFAAGGLTAVRGVLLAGAAGAAGGAAVIAAAPTPAVAGAGLALAAAGTAVLFPTLLRLVARNVDEDRRGRATSVVTTVSYLGFLAGPVYVGLWADAVGLRGAMVAVAALAVALLVLTPPLLRLSGFGGAARDGQARAGVFSSASPGRWSGTKR